MKTQLRRFLFVPTLIAGLAACLTPSLLTAQTTSDILENGIRIDQHNEMRFKFQGNVLKYQDYDKKRSSYFPLDDSLYFLSDRRVLIDIVALNPLNYSVTGVVKITDDALSKAEDGALQTLIEALKKINPAGGAAAAAPGVVGSPFDIIADQLNKLKAKLNNDKKKEIAATFNKLKQITFDRLTEALELKEAAEMELKDYAGFYKDLPKTISDIQTLINNYTEPGDQPAHDVLLARDVFNRQLADLNVMLQTQLVWVANLNKSYALVAAVFATAIESDGELIVQLDPVSVDRGKIANLSLTVSQDGFKLSDDNDIVSAEKKAVTTKVLRFRRFNHFVFEMAAGTAYTFLEYPKFGTTTDSTGKMHVADAGKESFKRFNLTAMFNWNYYIPNSNVHPFIQLGVGANAEYPAFFLGGGLRIHSDKGTHFAVAGGFASSWIKTLNKLKIGDPVSGSAELDKDITYEFKWPLRPYIGIQYNF